MFFATTAPALSRRQLYSPAGRSLERFLDEAVVSTRQKSAAIEQDQTSFTLSFDVPGIALMATSNSPTFGQSNSPRQDG